jgi:hypothetical protein
MMAEWEADQERMESKRKAHQEDLQKIMKEMMDANQTQTDENKDGIDADLKEMRE